MMHELYLIHLVSDVKWSGWRDDLANIPWDPQSCRFKGHTLIDFPPFTHCPQASKRQRGFTFTLWWWATKRVSLSQPIILKPGAFVSSRTFMPFASQIHVYPLCSEWSVEWPGWACYQIHYFTVIAQSNVYPPVDDPIIFPLSQYLPLPRPWSASCNPFAAINRTTSVRNTNLWARPLRLGEAEFDGLSWKKKRLGERRPTRWDYS